MQVINKIGQLWSRSLICFSQVWFQTELDNMKYCYLLIKTMTKFEKETRHKLYVFIKNNSRLNKILYNITHSWRVLSTYMGMMYYLSL